MELFLRDRVAIITGAGRGIGRAIAATLAEEGCRVAINDYFEKRARAAAEELAASGAEVLAVPADVTERAQVDAMVSRVVERWGTVHILVNNAGIAVVPEGQTMSGSGFFVETDPPGWDHTMGVITYGVLHCTHACLPHMLRQEYGKIVNIVSDAGRVGEPRLAAYSMAKAGVLGFSKALAKEVGRFKVNVNCVSPGATATEALAGSPVGAAGAHPEEQQRFQALLRQYPIGRGLGRIGLPQDVANAVAFLVSDRAEFIAGQTLSVNGGYAMV